MMRKTDTIAIIAPAYNEAASLPTFIALLNETTKNLTEKYGFHFRLIIVDDGSTDATVEVIDGQNANHLPTTLLSLSRNFGKESAISAGLDYADTINAAAVIIMDADMQHPLEIIDQFIEKWRKESIDVVFAYKASRKGEGRNKKWLSSVFYHIINTGNRFTIPRDGGDFRLMNAAAVRAIVSLPENQRFMKGIYAWIGLKQAGIPFEPDMRSSGKSTYSAMDLLLLSLDGLTSFTVAPLRYMAIFGLVIFALSSAYGAFIVIETIVRGTSGPGTASILTLISLFGGAQLFCIGLIGEYIGKILIETKRRPNYIIARKSHFPELE